MTEPKQRRVMECRCESILSPQMEYVPGAHHDLGCPMRREAAKWDFVVTGDAVRHQVRQYLKLLDVGWWYMIHGAQSQFFITRATDEQWDRIQAWVKKVTG